MTAYILVNCRYLFLKIIKLIIQRYKILKILNNRIYDSKKTKYASLLLTFIKYRISNSKFIRAHQGHVESTWFTFSSCRDHIICASWFCVSVWFTISNMLFRHTFAILRMHLIFKLKQKIPQVRIESSVYKQTTLHLILFYWILTVRYFRINQ